MLNYLNLPVEASAHAAEIDHMISLVHWLMLVLFVGWGIFFLYVLFRFRAGANPKASYTGAKGKISKGLEVAVALVEVILLVGYAIPAWARRVRDLPNENEAVRVRVVGEQFAWNIQYPGPDGKFGRTDIKLVSADNPLGLDRSDPAAKDDVTTINQLNLPVDRPVLIQLSSKDVIHSFGLYEMRVKQDSRDDDPRVVRSEPSGRVRDHMLAVVRPGPLPDARLRHNSVAGRLHQVVRRAAEGAAEVITSPAPRRCLSRRRGDRRDPRRSRLRPPFRAT
jgi:cytochrome c oxidase subunit 2